MTNETQPRRAKTRRKRRATLEHRPIIQHATDLHFGAATTEPPLQSDPQHVTPVTHVKPYATKHCAGLPVDGEFIFEHLDGAAAKLVELVMTRHYDHAGTGQAPRSHPDKPADGEAW